MSSSAKTSSNHPFSAPVLVNRLRLRPDYMGSERFMSTVAWREDRRGMHTLANAFNKRVSPKGMASITLIGRVSMEGTMCSPEGNYANSMAAYQRDVDGGASRLEPKVSDGKFTLTLRAPLEDSDIIGEWFLCMRRLRQLAGAVCDGGVGEHCIKVEEGQEDKFRTTQKMFGVRTSAADEIGGADETMNWPIAAEYKDKLLAIARTHCVMPLVLWNQNRGTPEPVLPEDAQTKLLGALVEVTFTLKHYSFKNKGNKPGNSHTLVADIQQLIVHRSALAEETSPFRKSRLIKPYIPIVPVISFDELERPDGSPTRGGIPTSPPPVASSSGKRDRDDDDDNYNPTSSPLSKRARTAAPSAPATAGASAAAHDDDEDALEYVDPVEPEVTADKEPDFGETAEPQEGDSGEPITEVAVPRAVAKSKGIRSAKPKAK